MNKTVPQRITIAIWVLITKEMVLQYTTSLSIGEDPIQFGPVVTKTRILVKHVIHVGPFLPPFVTWVWNCSLSFVSLLSKLGGNLNLQNTLQKS